MYGKKYFSGKVRQFWMKMGVVERYKAPEIITKAKLTNKKMILFRWWTWKGVVHYELPQPPQTNNSDLCCQQR